MNRRYLQYRPFWFVFTVVIVLGIILSVIHSRKASTEFEPIRELAQPQDGWETYVLYEHVEEKHIPTYFAYPVNGNEKEHTISLQFTRPLIGEGKIDLTDADLPRTVKLKSPAWTMVRKMPYDGRQLFELEIAGEWNILDRSVQSPKEDADVKGPLQLTLFNAAVDGDLTEIKRRVHKGAAVNAKDGFGLTALHYACDHNHLAIVKFLVSEGADVTVKQWEGRTPLDHATLNGNVEIAEYLVGKGADVNIPNLNGMTPLHHAVSKARIELVAFLIHKGANVNAKNRQGGTPLHFAAHFGDLKLVQLLVSKGAKLDSADKVGLTPLDVASKAKKNDIVSYLRDRLSP